MALATSGRTVAAAALLAVAVWSTSCSTPPPHGGISRTVATPSISAAPTITKPVPVCFGRPAGNWARAFTHGGVTLARGVSFTLGALSGDKAFGQFNSATGSGIAELDLATGTLTKVSAYAAGVSGFGGMAADLPWVVWEQLDSQTNLLDWRIYAWNETTGARTLLATSRQSDGGYVNGQQPLPVLSHGVTAWAQPVPGASGQVRAQIRVLHLATGRESTVGSGRVSSPVYAGRYLVWGALSDRGAYSFHAVDATTLSPVTLPEQVRQPASIGFLAGSPQYLAWSSGDYTGLTVWRIGASGYGRFAASDRSHHFQYLQLAGRFVLWFSGAASSVLDLRTGDAFDVNGTVAASGERITIAQTAAAGGAAAKGQFTASRVASIATRAAPPIAGCR